MTLLRRLAIHCSILGALPLFANACSSSDPGANAVITQSLDSKSIPAAAAAPQGDDIGVALQKVPGVVEVTENSDTFPGTRLFLVRFEQPIDHLQPQGPKFTQRFTLLFQSYDAPMVLDTTGYDIPTTKAREELTSLLGANQILLEHRFFGGSTPAPQNWEKLDIFQMATDQHRIVQALQPLFTKKWISTGISKGGMTAVYHRFFYPDDVAATVPYVAPQSFSRSDPGYISFLDRVGTPECRRSLRAFQTEVLRRRNEIEPLMLAEATEVFETYYMFGLDRALDYSVNEAVFTFWQFGLARDCTNVPPVTASTQELFDFLSKIYFSDLSSAFGDYPNLFYAPYYYQTATELGGPGYDYSPLQGYATPHFRDLPQDFPPFHMDKPFRPARIQQVSAWVEASAQRMLFIYGENDPWSSHAYQVRAENDSYRYIVPGSNHFTRIAQLSPDQQREALANISRWMDAPVAQPAQSAPRSFIAPEVKANALDDPDQVLMLWPKGRRRR